MYAIVRCGGRQEKASVDDVLTVDKMAGDTGSTVTLPAVLVVDDGTVVSDPAQLSRYAVTAEILGTVSGPKINMIHYRNKTGYKRRLGHRQRHTQLKITAIGPARGGSSKASAPATRESQEASGGTKAKPAGSSGGTRSRSRSTAGTAGTSRTTGTSRTAGTGSSGTRKTATGSGGRSGSARKPAAGKPAASGKTAAGEAATGDKPGAAGKSASGGQES